MSNKMHIKLNVNGKDEEFLAEPRELLIYTLRERLNITGPHIGCETSHCGACTVTIDGKSVKSCTMFAAQASGKSVTTVEGIGGPDALHSVARGIQRTSWLAVWLLHSGDDHPSSKATRRNSKSI